MKISQRLSELLRGHKIMMDGQTDRQTQTDGQTDGQGDYYRALLTSSMLFFLLINVKMPTIDGILTFINRKNFVLSCVEHEKSFITVGPVCMKIS